MPSKYIDTVSSYNKETPPPPPPPPPLLFAHILLSSYLSNITVTNTVHGKILEVEIIITNEAIGEENFGKSAGCLSVIPVYLYILARKIWRIIYLQKFSHVL